MMPWGFSSLFSALSLCRNFFPSPSHSRHLALAPGEQRPSDFRLAPTSGIYHHIDTSLDPPLTTFHRLSHLPTHHATHHHFPAAVAVLHLFNETRISEYHSRRRPHVNVRRVSLTLAYASDSRRSRTYHYVSTPFGGLLSGPSLIVR